MASSKNSCRSSGGHPHWNFANLKTHFRLETVFPAFKLTQSCCINMKISLLDKWQFCYKLAPPPLHMPESLIIWQNMKIWTIREFQIFNFSVNWEKFESINQFSISFMNWEKLSAPYRAKFKFSIFSGIRKKFKVEFWRFQILILA